MQGRASQFTVDPSWRKSSTHTSMKVLFSSTSYSHLVNCSGISHSSISVLILGIAKFTFNLRSFWWSLNLKHRIDVNCFHVHRHVAENEY